MNSDRVDRYLNEVCWALDAPLPQAQAVRDELRAHIDDSVREEMLSGAAREAAVEGVLVAMGDPSDVGRAMRTSRGSAPLRRPLAQPDGALIFGGTQPHPGPRPLLLIVLGAAAVMSAIVGVAYAWPG